ncbi:MAG TPA: alanine racemase [Candidatus Omnitrophota bacterium]|nr:alanine racemase [Candidatus Omnitrophota bacterium]
MSKDLRPLTWVEVDLSAVRHNFAVIKRLAGSKSRILAVVKAEAYGHGMDRIAKILDKLHAGYLGVSDVQEGIRLRKLGIKGPVLLFESTLPQQASAICDHHLIPTVCTRELASALNRCAQRAGRRVKVHVKVDTGMGRLGVWHADAFSFIEQVSRLPYLIIDGIYTHFPAADTDKKFTQRQIRQLHDLVRKLDRKGIIIPTIHASNSMGLAGYRTKMLNLFRPGLMLYGLYPQARLKKLISLKPAMSVHSRIIFLKRIEKGRSISYGRTFIAKAAMTVATIPIGYSDGYPRLLSNKADVLVGGKRCRLLGRVTMDQIVADVTKVKGARLGTPVVILGKQSSHTITADELAAYANTISYEIVCSLGNNIPRIYK